MTSAALPTVELYDLVNAWRTASVAGLHVGLYTNANLVPTSQTTIDIFTVPVGSWYTPKAATFNPTNINSDNSVEVSIVPPTWTQTSTSEASENIQGWFAFQTISSIDTLLASRQLEDGAVNMGAAYSAVTAEPAIVFPAINQS